MSWSWFNPKCPACARRRLVTRNSVLATVLVDRDGKMAGEGPAYRGDPVHLRGDLRRAPASFTYYECEGCGARWRASLGGPWETPPEDEWEEYVGRRRSREPSRR